ncbi:hypothetical protein H4W31_007459 [Plantactinospora soyae]|uniref:Uncharacterized protein n=1 Tax=Plantactinospora soyae TaxID=1544732 RepID=A0A927RBL4_9ACTN|nr:hypothetical protein [Plantactinospora soyae]
MTTFPSADRQRQRIREGYQLFRRLRLGEKVTCSAAVAA